MAVLEHMVLKHGLQLKTDFIRILSSTQAAQIRVYSM